METQTPLIPGYYRCDNCGTLTAARVRKLRRWRLCDTCWEHCAPPWLITPGTSITSEGERDGAGAYWQWVSQMERRYPTRDYTPPSRMATPPLTSEDLNPICKCGGLREPSKFDTDRAGLFGGPYRDRCPVCDAKANVPTLVRMAQVTHPEWDDEDWLEYLFQRYRKYFELGVLPDAWFAVKYEAMRKASSEPQESEAELAAARQKGERAALDDSYRMPPRTASEQWRAEYWAGWKAERIRIASREQGTAGEAEKGNA